jgi:hypothetical protein
MVPITMLPVVFRIFPTLNSVRKAVPFPVTLTEEADAAMVPVLLVLGQAVALQLPDAALVTLAAFRDCMEKNHASKYPISLLPAELLLWIQNILMHLKNDRYLKIYSGLINAQGKCYAFVIPSNQKNEKLQDEYGYESNLFLRISDLITKKR